MQADRVSQILLGWLGKSPRDASWLACSFPQRSVYQMIMIRNILFRVDAKTALKTMVLWQKSKTEVFKHKAE
jgi:hypothetical protein